MDLSRSCYQSALVSVGDCLAAAELLTTERNELAKECQRLMADLAAAREREQRLRAALDPERIAGDIASSLGDIDYQPNQCAQEHPDGMCINVNDLMGTIENYIREAIAAAAPSAVAQEPRGEGV